MLLPQSTAAQEASPAHPRASGCLGMPLLSLQEPSPTICCEGRLSSIRGPFWNLALGLRMKIHPNSCTPAFPVCLLLQGLLGKAGNLSGLGPANLVSLITRDMPLGRDWTSANLCIFLYTVGGNSSDLSSTCDVPGTVLDFP